MTTHTQQHEISHTHTDIDLCRTCEQALDSLDARSRDIIDRRFGISQDKRETLESIGQEYGITRERVRQIESHAKKQLMSLSDIFKDANILLVELFETHGGLLHEQHIAELVKDTTHRDVSEHIIHFHLHVLPDFRFIAQDTLLDTHWQHNPSLHDNPEVIVQIATDILKNHTKPMPLENLVKSIQSHIEQEHGHSLPREYVYAALRASKHIDPTAFGDWGLVGWPETSPRGVGDKAFAVLRRHNKPAHFREITDMINKAKFDHKQANPQTVHNELIKDGRFVLVGRGLYGLKEWGFVAGTVADVLESILKKHNNEPLTQDKLIEDVLKQRLVKKNTIILSLQNSKKFKRFEGNRYALSEESL